MAALEKKLDTIHFPITAEDFRRVKTVFFMLGKIPNVIGAVDGTLIPIIAPSEAEEVYVCRKGYHAINVQAVVDHEMRYIILCLQFIIFLTIQIHVSLFLP